MAMFVCLKSTTFLAKYDAVAFETAVMNQVVMGQLLHTSDIIYGGRHLQALPPVVKNRLGNAGTDKSGFRKWLNRDQIRVAIWHGVLTIPQLVLARNAVTCQFLQENLSRTMEIDQFTADMLELTFEPYHPDMNINVNNVIQDEDRCHYRAFGQLSE